MRIASNMLELVGGTPLVRLNRIGKGLGAELVAKLEYYNPASSIKDRVAVSMVEDAEKSGILKPHSVLIEPTSGNAGIGLAFVAAVKGYRSIIVMPENMSEERKNLVRGMGATLVLTPKAGGIPGAISEAKRLAAQTPDAVMLSQFSNPANPAIHYTATAEEIWRDTAGAVDAFVSITATGGTITGTGKRLKELNPDILVCAVEPAESPVLSGGVPGPHGIQGTGPGMVPEIFDTTLLDRVFTVSTQDAVAMARRLIKEEGILCGISSGGALHAALRLAEEPGMAGKRIVFIVCDTAERYLSTELFTEMN